MCSDITVVRNDQISAEDTDAFTHIVLSPGPGLPRESGNLMEIVDRQVLQKPILGICLGLQAIALHFGGTLYNQEVVRHGVTTTIDRDLDSPLYTGTPPKFTVGLYHSWAVREQDLPPELKVTARSETGVLMSLEHESLPVTGIQFHPESILTAHGKRLLANWLLLTQTA